MPPDVLSMIGALVVGSLVTVLVNRAFAQPKQPDCAMHDAAVKAMQKEMEKITAMLDEIFTRLRLMEQDVAIIKHDLARMETPAK